MWRHKAEMVSCPQQAIVEQMASAKAAAAMIGENIMREFPVIFIPASMQRLIRKYGCTKLKWCYVADRGNRSRKK
jgi:hypothetical protein